MDTGGLVIESEGTLVGGERGSLDCGPLRNDDVGRKGQPAKAKKMPSQNQNRPITLLIHFFSASWSLQVS